jgi:hypothetical protein
METVKADDKATIGEPSRSRVVTQASVSLWRYNSLSGGESRSGLAGLNALQPLSLQARETNVCVFECFSTGTS